MNICLSAGGTGGHIYPAIALGDKLYELGHTIFYIGNKNKMEETLIKEKPYTFLPIQNEGLKPGVLAKIKGITSQFKAIRQAKKYLKENDIDLLVSFGGYVAFPACVAAKQLKIPYLIHEQNSIAGKANKAVSKDAQGIIVCFENAIHQFKHHDIRLLGNPRASIAASIEKDDQYRTKLNLDSELPIVYIVMGSLGSSSISTVLCDTLIKHPLTNFQIVISSGSKNYQNYQSIMDLEHVFVFESVDQLQMLKHASLVISRAGATSIAEISAAQVPAIFIPSPYVVANHQYHNALEYAQVKAALLVLEKDLDGTVLLETINELIFNPQKLQEMSNNYGSLSKPNATADIIAWIDEVLT